MELRGAGMPCVAQVRVAEIEDWNGQPPFRPLDDDFADWCDYLARVIAAEHADSADLLGYFLVDIPAWLPHASGRDFAELVGLDAAARQRKLYDVASRYYETIATAIRRYAPHHLILGDRFNGNKKFRNRCCARWPRTSTHCRCNISPSPPTSPTRGCTTTWPAGAQCGD